MDGWADGLVAGLHDPSFQGFEVSGGFCGSGDILAPDPLPSQVGYLDIVDVVTCAVLMAMCFCQDCTISAAACRHEGC